MTTHSKIKLKKLLEEIKKYSGRHTELVSVYIPAGYELNKIVSHISDEQNTATNIKSTSTRKNVIDALERILQYLKLFDKTPENGLAIFSGNVSEMEGKSDMQIWGIVPPAPLNQRVYRCDKTFVVEPLEEMFTHESKYALVVLDKREATLGYLTGKSISVVKTLTSIIPGKTRAGGQSAPRFARLREGAKIEFFKKIAHAMKEKYLFDTEIKGILIGGPGPTKDDFINKDYLTGDLKKKILAIKDIGYTDESGLHELLNASKDILANEEVMSEKVAVGQFLEYLLTNPNKVSYGVEDVRNNLYSSSVDELLLSETLDIEIIDELSEIAEKTGTKITIVSTDTNEGVQLKQFGGVAAILRF